jgi:hypothetical protein
MMVPLIAAEVMQLEALLTIRIAGKVPPPKGLTGTFRLCDPCAPELPVATRVCGVEVQKD